MGDIVGVFNVKNSNSISKTPGVRVTSTLSNNLSAIPDVISFRPYLQNSASKGFPNLVPVSLIARAAKYTSPERS
ncbi:unnamed protein product [Rhizophagus irregularis]|nr:unnamed protein product [Rhizophagus irregularis]